MTSDAVAIAFFIGSLQLPVGVRQTTVTGRSSEGERLRNAIGLAPGPYHRPAAVSA